MFWGLLFSGFMFSFWVKAAIAFIGRNFQPSLRSWLLFLSCYCFLGFYMSSVIHFDYYYQYIVAEWCLCFVLLGLFCFLGLRILSKWLCGIKISVDSNFLDISQVLNHSLKYCLSSYSLYSQQNFGNKLLD